MTNLHHALGTFEHFPVKISSRHSIRLVTAWIANSLEPEKGCCNSQVISPVLDVSRDLIQKTKATRQPHVVIMGTISLPVTTGKAPSSLGLNSPRRL